MKRASYCAIVSGGQGGISDMDIVYNRGSLSLDSLNSVFTFLYELRMNEVPLPRWDWCWFSYFVAIGVSKCVSVSRKQTNTEEVRHTSILVK